MARPTTRARPTLDIIVETEKNEKEKRLYPYREIPFHANLAEKPLTGKFYARHDCIDVSLESTDLEEAIKRKQCSTPKDRSTYPETCNQEYGWYLEPLLEIDRTDRRFYHPQISSWINRIGALIDMEMKKMPKKPFTGIPFRV